MQIAGIYIDIGKTVRNTAIGKSHLSKDLVLLHSCSEHCFLYSELEHKNDTVGDSMFLCLVTKESHRIEKMYPSPYN